MEQEIESIISEMEKDLKELNLNLDKLEKDKEYASYWFCFGKFWAIQKYLTQLKITNDRKRNNETGTKGA